MDNDTFERRYLALESARIDAVRQIAFVNQAADVLQLSVSDRRKSVAKSTLSGDNLIKKTDLVNAKWRPTYLIPSDLYRKTDPRDLAKSREYSKWIKKMRTIQRKQEGWR